MLIGFIHIRQHINLRKKECPDRGTFIGARPLMTPFGDEERMSVRRTYVAAARSSVTGITCCAAKVGLLITRQMDCRGLADWRLIKPNQTRGSIMAKRKKGSKVQSRAKLRRANSARRGKARKVAKTAKRTAGRAKPKPAPVKKAARKVKQPVAPVVETAVVEVIEQPAPGVIAVTEVEETEVRKAS
jgi:hypothetical protein